MRAASADPATRRSSALAKDSTAALTFPAGEVGPAEVLADGGLLQGALGLGEELAEHLHGPVEPVRDPEHVRLEDPQPERAGVLVAGLGEELGGFGRVPFDEPDEDRVPGVRRGRQRLGQASSLTIWASGTAG